MHRSLEGHKIGSSRTRRSHRSSDFATYFTTEAILLHILLRKLASIGSSRTRRSQRSSVMSSENLEVFPLRDTETFEKSREEKRFYVCIMYMHPPSWSSPSPCTAVSPPAPRHLVVHIPFPDDTTSHGCGRVAPEGSACAHTRTNIQTHARDTALCSC